METTARTRLYLEMPVQFLKGVGERRAELLKRLNIRTAGDLLYHVPHRYDDASTITPIASVDVGKEVTIIGRVVSKGILPTRKGLLHCIMTKNGDAWLITVMHNTELGPTR